MTLFLIVWSFIWLKGVRGVEKVILMTVIRCSRREQSYSTWKSHKRLTRKQSSFGTSLLRAQRPFIWLCLFGRDELTYWHQKCVFSFRFGGCSWFSWKTRAFIRSCGQLSTSCYSTIVRGMPTYRPRYGKVYFISISHCWPFGRLLSFGKHGPSVTEWVQARRKPISSSRS